MKNRYHPTADVQSKSIGEKTQIWQYSVFAAWPNPSVPQSEIFTSLKGK